MDETDRTDGAANGDADQGANDGGTGDEGQGEAGGGAGDEGQGEAGTDGAGVAGAGQDETAGSGTDGQPRKVGDVGKALQAERGRRKVAEEVNRRLQERLDSLVQAGPSREMKLDVGDEDILDGRQVKRLLEDHRRALRQDVAGLVQGQVRATELMGFIDSFEAFSLDTGIGALGREALTARLAGIPSVATADGMEQAKAAVEDVARQISEGHAAGANAAARRGAGGARTLAPGPGAATATHVRMDKDVPDTPEGMQEAARVGVRGIWNRITKRN
jgi:hypothetical protein